MSWNRSRLIPGLAVRSGLVAASAAIVLLFAALVLVSMKAEREALAGVETHQQVIETSERAISRMAEAELAQRDFLLTGDSAYQRQYAQVVGQLRADIQAMRHTGRDRGDSIASRRLERTVQSRLERLALSMHLRDRAGVGAATRAVDPTSGTTELDGLRALARARIASEEGELDAQASLLRNRSTIVLWILFGGSALAVVLTAGLAVILGAYAREREDTAGALEHSNLQLREQASELEVRQEELQRTSAELRHSEERLRALVEHATDVISVVDAHGRIRYESPSAGTILGYAPSRIGDDFFDHVHPEERSGARSAFQRLLDSNAPLQLSSQMRVRHRDGGWRWLTVHGQNLLRHPAVGGVVLTGHDVTESRLLEEQFRQAQKLEAVGRMASGIAHDFNNLITTMQGYLSLAVDEIDADSPVRSDLEEVRRATDHAALLTQQLLAFSRREVVQPTMLRLNDVVTETMRLLRRILGEDVRVDTVLEPELGAVVADRTQLQQVMMNLVVNAKDAMPSGGTLLVATRNVDLSGDSTPGSVAPGSYVLLSVGDTGHGMDEATRQRIFEPFFTTKEVGKGTGLGLSTVYGIVKRHEGHILVDSEPGQGTTFEIYLPRATNQPAEPDSPASSDASHAPGTETILVVEDEAPVRRLARRILVSNGYTVLEAGNGRDAVRLCDSHPGRVDLVLTDVVMPHMSGREVVDTLTQRYPGIRVIFTSGYASDIVSERGGFAGADAFLEKPFSSAHLLEQVKAVLARVHDGQTGSHHDGARHPPPLGRGNGSGEGRAIA